MEPSRREIIETPETDRRDDEETNYTSTGSDLQYDVYRIANNTCTHAHTLCILKQGELKRLNHQNKI